jgi:DNA-binding response OmpR family regulator
MTSAYEPFAFAELAARIQALAPAARRIRDGREPRDVVGAGC